MLPRNFEISRVYMAHTCLDSRRVGAVCYDRHDRNIAQSSNRHIEIFHAPLDHHDSVLVSNI
jgi:hypothetical protein